MGIRVASRWEGLLPGLPGIQVGRQITAESKDVALAVENLLVQVEEMLAVGGHLAPAVAAVADRPASQGRPELPRPRLVAEPTLVSVPRPVSIGR